MTQPRNVTTSLFVFPPREGRCHTDDAHTRGGVPTPFNKNVPELFQLPVANDSTRQHAQREKARISRLFFTPYHLVFLGLAPRCSGSNPLAASSKDIVFADRRSLCFESRTGYLLLSEVMSSPMPRSITGPALRRRPARKHRRSRRLDCH
jgi:hypothetical protein